MNKLWQKITYYRHRSELLALRLALRMPLLAPILIGTVLCFWWGIAGLSVLIPVLLVLGNLGPLGGVILAIPALAMLFFAIPWFFGWYCIAASLMFGRTAAAEAREKTLAGAIHAYRAKSA